MQFPAYTILPFYLLFFKPINSIRVLSPCYKLLIYSLSFFFPPKAVYSGYKRIAPTGYPIPKNKQMHKIAVKNSITFPSNRQANYKMQHTVYQRFQRTGCFCNPQTRLLFCLSMSQNHDSKNQV